MVQIHSPRPMKSALWFRQIQTHPSELLNRSPAAPESPARIDSRLSGEAPRNVRDSAENDGKRTAGTGGNPKAQVMVT
jgi:hypothetical protein